MDSISELGGYYSVGIYGPRNICIKVSEAMPIKSSFVSSMSTGFSSNLGFPLPYNWAFDQISTITIGTSAGSIEIDNNIKSGRDTGQTSVNKTIEITPVPDVLLQNEFKVILQNEIISLLYKQVTGWPDVKSLSSPEQAAAFIIKYDAEITRVCKKYNIRKALLQSVFQREYAFIGGDDIAADEIVLAYHRRRPESELKPETTFSKSDSSTGCCQIFARVAIDAMNYAMDKGIYSGTRYNKKSLDDVFTVWNKLQSNEFSIEMCGLVLLYGASTVGIPVSTSNNFNYNPEQIKKNLARYNGSGEDAIRYGNEAYELYKIFEKCNMSIR